MQVVQAERVISAKGFISLAARTATLQMACDFLSGR